MAYEANPIDTDPLVHKAALDLARASFEYYVYYSFNRSTRRKFLRNWHHKAICEALWKVYTGQTKRLIINIPPRYSKTLIAVVKFIAWCLGKNPACEFIHTSYATPLAQKNAYQIRAEVQSDWYRELFPETIISDDSSARGDWRTTRGGAVYATGMKGSITGFGAGKTPEDGVPWVFSGAIIVDDPHKPKGALSDVQRKEVLDFYSDTLESRTNDPENTPIIVIMQRLHDEDLAGFLMNGGSGEKWETLIIPIEDEDGEPLWAIKHDRAKIASMKAANPAVFAAQYNQNPRQAGGNVFKTAWFKRYRLDELPKMRFRCVIADTASKTKTRNDPSAFGCFGYGVDGQLYVLDIKVGRWEAPDLRKQARMFWRKHLNAGRQNPALGALRDMLVEDKSSGTGLIQDLRRGDPEKQIVPIPVVPIQRNIDKVTRADDASPIVEVGRVSVPHDDEGVEWLVAYLDEMEAFSREDTHKHDDQVDITMDAIKRLGVSLDLSDVL